MTETLMLDAALRYAAADWRVFPCWWTPAPGLCACPDGAAERTRKGDKHTKGKHPMTVHGFNDATTDIGAIAAWWTRWPAANIGLATGLPAPDVVDVDTKDGRSGAESRARLAGAGLLRGAFAEVITASGGQHLYYPGSDQRSSNRPRAGIDFRSHGGYVIAPPSIVDGRPYEVADKLPLMTEGFPVDWSRIVAFLEPARPKPDTWSGLRRHSPGALSRWAERELGERITQPVGKGARSEQFWELARLCRLAGMSETEAAATLTPWCETTGKYVGRVDREISRVWHKVEVPA